MPCLIALLTSEMKRKPTTHLRALTFKCSNQPSNQVLIQMVIKHENKSALAFAGLLLVNGLGLIFLKNNLDFF